jgi:AraC family transcriptional activator of pobA
MQGLTVRLAEENAHGQSLSKQVLFRHHLRHCITFTMAAASAFLRLVPFSEVRHEQPDDCIHYEPVSTRFREMNWTIPAHCHEGLHQFQLLSAGRLEGSIDGQMFEATAPTLLMLAAGSTHGFTYSHDAVGHQITVPTVTLRRLLDGSALAEEGFGSSFILLGLSEATAAQCVGLFEHMGREFHARRAGRVHSLLALTTLLAVCVGRERGEQFDQGGRRGPRDALMQRFLLLVDGHYREQWPLADYAQALGVTPDHLSRTCRMVSGDSALQMLHERVLLEARRLLAYTPMPVTEIAGQLGYADTPYFSRFFRRGTGHTPSEYRQLIAQGVCSVDLAQPDR